MGRGTGVGPRGKKCIGCQLRLHVLVKFFKGWPIFRFWLFNELVSNCEISLSTI